MAGSSGNHRKRKKPSENQTAHKQKNTSISLTSEIVLLFCLLLSILLFISNFGIGGRLTRGLSDLFFGIFGVAAYVFPVVFAAVVFFIVSSSRIHQAGCKVAAFLLFTLALCLFAQILDAKQSSNYDLGALFLYARRTHHGGGFIGGAVYKLMYGAIGTVGAIILAVFLFIISGVLLTGKSFLKLLSEQSAKLVGNAKQEVRERKNRSETNRAPERNAASETTGEFVMPVLKETNEKQEEKTVVRRKKSRKEQAESAADVSDIQLNQAARSASEPEEELPASLIKPKRAKANAAEETKEITPELPVIPEPASAAASEEEFILPPIRLFQKNRESADTGSGQQLKETAQNLQNTLRSFGVNVNITDVSRGPAVTRYEFRPEPGVKVSRILSLADDIKLNLAVNDIRIEAPVPGKAAVGIEVPNAKKSAVLIRDLFESKELLSAKSPLACAAGKDVSGRVIVADLSKMPHMLISGTTGSGKSVFTNSILITFLYRCKPQDVKFIIIDPKVVEFGVYNGIPNLIIPVVTDPKKAAGALNWAVSEMTARYKKFADMHVRDLDSYNKCIDEKQYEFSLEEGEEIPERLPRIVIIIDELADLMMVAAREVEEAICRLAQLARAAGIHMIIATQRPSVDVITGLIKANVPSRVALTVASGTDSRTILDMNGAEKLLGSGDMLFYPSDYPKPIRVQGAFVSDKEIADVVAHLKNQNKNVSYDERIIQKIESNAVPAETQTEQVPEDGKDELFWEAGALICDKQKASIGSLQRVFRIGFNRAARIMDQLCEANVVGPEQGTKAREILMTAEEFELFRNAKPEEAAK